MHLPLCTAAVKENNTQNIARGRILRPLLSQEGFSARGKEAAAKLTGIFFMERPNVCSRSSAGQDYLLGFDVLIVIY